MSKISFELTSLNRAFERETVFELHNEGNHLFFIKHNPIEKHIKMKSSDNLMENVS